MARERAAKTPPVETMVIAYDGTSNARRAVQYAGRLLAFHRAVVLTVWSPVQRGQAPAALDLDGPPDVVDDDDIDMAYADAQRTNAEGVALAQKAGLTADPLCAAIQGTVWGTIIEAADKLDAALIVTGTRGTTGLRSLMQSSVADNVLRRGHRPVLIVPPGR
ncbi:MULTISPECIES: universal stress protein [Mycobacteriaceae]|uniref:universal stress protein n=1 Tax=Mycobacteriaceae TaxID=1762 RepID=UPI000800BFEB|nr:MULTISPECIES: universal stress protein [Mycobacteriaceae]MCK0177208.1 universal stress protein [Mycolicibacterium sp. F2034L]OBB59523.1 universal stress protein UspA [Mycobacterium sp. 852013-51886_SCH5428379]